MGRTSNFPLLWESLVLWPCSSYFLNRFIKWKGKWLEIGNFRTAGAKLVRKPFWHNYLAHDFR